jgi:hypothetical protein
MTTFREPLLAIQKKFEERERERVEKVDDDDLRRKKEKKQFK